MQSPLAQPLDKALLQSEVTHAIRLCDTRHGGNTVYCFRGSERPLLMREVGRLREEAYRAGGGGSGCEVDIDADDLAPDGYHQIIVWNPVEREVVGGYRYIVCRTPRPQHLSTEHYFRFSDLFRRQYLPHTLELGRAFVQPAFQASCMRGLYSLDNLWDGLGAVVAANTDVRYLLGKVTIFSTYPRAAREKLLYFLNRFFPDADRLVQARHPLRRPHGRRLEALFAAADYPTNLHALQEALRGDGAAIPPLIHSYMALSRTMRVLGTMRNRDFGDGFETGILLTVADIELEKRQRYIHR